MSCAPTAIESGDVTTIISSEAAAAAAAAAVDKVIYKRAPQAALVRLDADEPRQMIRTDASRKLLSLLSGLRVAFALTLAPKQLRFLSSLIT